MSFSEIKKILLRLFNQYVKKHLNKLILSVVLYNVFVNISNKSSTKIKEI